MQEIELKFQIPLERVEGVRQAIEHLSSPHGLEPLKGFVSLHAAYFDTADNALARQKMALRVRREGDEWVQTFKAAGEDAMTRVEDNQPRHVPNQGLPAPDLCLHPLAAQQALMRALPWQPAQDPRGEALGLVALYETRFERRQARIAWPPQGEVIICIDEGEIVAGPLSEPLAELEMELAQGHPSAVLDLARQWVRRHGLWLDVHSKAYRGTRLAQARSQHQTPFAQPVSPETSADPKRQLSLALDAAAGNWSEVAFQRPGWSAALLAWQSALNLLLGQARQRPDLHALLPASAWQATQDQARTLASFIGSFTLEQTAAHEQDPAWRRTAQALARHPDTTHWALDLLQALKS